MESIRVLFSEGHGSETQKFKLTLILVFCSTMILFSRIFSPISVIVVGFSILVIEFMAKNRASTHLTTNEMIFSKLQALQATTNSYIEKSLENFNGTKKLSQIEIDRVYAKNELNNLYVDSDLIIFLHSILILNTYNPDLFYRLLKGTNNILRLRNETETFFLANGTYPNNIHEMTGDALRLESLCINILHDFTYTIPKEKQMYNYIKDITFRYSYLVHENTEILKTYSSDYVKINGVDRDTKFFPKRQVPLGVFKQERVSGTNVPTLQRFYRTE